jgi:hypothetical protein
VRTYAVPLVVALLLAGSVAVAREGNATTDKPDCLTEEPDSVQVSWSTPCDSGDWLFDTELGCRMWDWHPDPHDRASWTGECLRGLKEGLGVVQWYEHGRPIDRFEGTFRHGRREGPGRYRWNESSYFDGVYADDVPHGHGTVSVAGETFTGEWAKGCLRSGDRVVAVGVPRASCPAVPSATVTRDPSASF